MAAGTIPRGRARAHEAQETYRCDERVQWGRGQGREREQGRPPLRLEWARKVLLDRALHSQTAIKHDVNEIGIGHDIGDGSKGRELAQRVASKGGIRLDKAFRE